MIRPLYVALASAVQARLNCIESGNVEWCDRHEERIGALVKAGLPSGSGFDAGTTLDLDTSTGSKLVLNTSYHHMTEGSYDGWTDHTVTVTASMVDGFDLKVSGRDRNQIKDYIGDAFGNALREKVTREGRIVRHTPPAYGARMTPAGTELVFLLDPSPTPTVIVPVRPGVEPSRHQMLVEHLLATMNAHAAETSGG